MILRRAPLNLSGWGSKSSNGSRRVGVEVNAVAALSVPSKSSGASATPPPAQCVALGCQFTKKVDKIEANGSKNRGEYDPIAVSLAAARQVTKSAELVPS